jgi:branched-chain amino acid aminotransferase
MSPTATTTVRCAWVDGGLIDLAVASVPITAPGLHYGTGAFEGIRAYDTADGLALFRPREHFERLHRSAAVLGMEVPYTVEELLAACHDVVRESAGECYIRPIVIETRERWRLAEAGANILVAIIAWPKPSFFGPDGMEHGIRLLTSSVRWPAADVLPRSVKLTGAYVNSSIASGEATAAGFDEALMLTSDGRVADTAGDNVFLVAGGVLVTPDLATGILPGITRDSVLQLARSAGLEVAERPVAAPELDVATEVFVCGTSSELTPVRAINDREYVVGPVTHLLQETYLDVVHGRLGRWAHWLDYVG